MYLDLTNFNYRELKTRIAIKRKKGNKKYKQIPQSLLFIKTGFKYT